PATRPEKGAPIMAPGKKDPSKGRSFIVPTKLVKNGYYRVAILCPEGIGIVILANVLMIVGELTLAVWRGESVYFLFLVAHLLILGLVVPKAVALYLRRAKDHPPESGSHIHHV